jgi:hypothetical protein
MNEQLLRLIVANFWRLLLALLLFLLGLLFAIFGWAKALLILALTLLGYLVGKWMDEGRPTAGMARRLRDRLEE